MEQQPGNISDGIQNEVSNNFGGLTPGRIVHYVLETGVHRPAILLHIRDSNTSLVDLIAFCDPEVDARTGVLELVIHCTLSRDGQPGTWHWIEGSFTDTAHEALLEKIRSLKERKNSYE